MISSDILAVKCKLCRLPVSKVGPNRLSHIIPRFILLMAKIGGKSLTFNLSQKEYGFSQEDWKEELLCEGCENIMRKHEDLLNELLFLRRKKPPIFETADHTRIWADSDQLALALMSVFWRATISTIPAYSWPDAPDHIKDTIRSWIWENRLPHRWSEKFEIKVQNIIFPGLEDDNFRPVIPPFFRDVAEPDSQKRLEFIFVCGGYCWTFSILGRQYEQIYSRTKAIRPGAHTVHIANVYFSEIPELNRLMVAAKETPMSPEQEEKVRRMEAEIKARRARGAKML